MLLDYAWPGNVRELENVVKRFVILKDEGLLLRQLRSASVYEGLSPSPRVQDREAIVSDDAQSLLELARHAAVDAERTAIVRTLTESRWNRRKAARQLGVSYKTLLNKMKVCGISDTGHSDVEPSEPRP
jgi:DNA-binding NtrC family response regulator